MNRRFFLGGATAAVAMGMAGTAASLSRSFSNETQIASNTKPACTAVTVRPPSSAALEKNINSIRATLARHQLLNVKDDVVDFYNDVVDRYIAAFGEGAVLDADGAYRDEIDEAAMILDDPKCFTANPPEEGCTYYEVWKFYRHRDAMKMFPTDGTVSFASLSPMDQHFVSTGTVAYAGMLMNLFGSLTGHLKLQQQTTRQIMALDHDAQRLFDRIHMATPCDKPQPGKGVPTVSAPSMVA